MHHTISSPPMHLRMIFLIYGLLCSVYFVEELLSQPARISDDFLFHQYWWALWGAAAASALLAMCSVSFERASLVVLVFVMLSRGTGFLVRWDGFGVAAASVWAALSAVLFVVVARRTVVHSA